MARSRSAMVDLIVAIALCTATLLAGLTGPHQRGGAVSGPAVVAAVIAYGALLGRRRWPVAALMVTVVAAAVHMVLTGTHGWVVAAPLLALYHLADITGDRRRLLVVGGFAVLVLVALPTLFVEKSWLSAENLAVTAVCGLALAAGDAARSRRAYIGGIEERARRAEYSREQDARRRVVEERLRIARDLHDSMGHHIALISAQAALAGYVFDRQPATAKQALGHIHQASRAALDDLRDTIGLLRQAGDLAAPTEPTGGVADLYELVASFRRSGMRIEQLMTGAVRPLPPAADLTVFRVVQESLTNVRKHAGDATARVQLSFRPEAVCVTVDDEGNGRVRTAAEQQELACGRDGSGHGLMGMRERVAAVGGSLTAGPRQGGGFRVSADLPLPGVGAS
jgi:signal transduction histidine kinase